MTSPTLLNALPVWALFPLTMLIVMASIELGFRVGDHRRRTREEEDRPSVGEIVAATLALLAFMLGFTFSLAAARFETRRLLVIDEANAIGTTHLRAGFLAEPHRSEVRALLQNYVTVRLEATDLTKLERVARHSEELHGRLWSHAETVAQAQPNSIVVGLFVESLNDVIDLHTKRLMLGVRNPIPLSIWLTLFLLAASGTFVMGYHAGLSGARRSVALLAMMVAFSVVITLILDLDRPQEGWLRVSQEPLVELLRTISPTR